LPTLTRTNPKQDSKLQAATIASQPPPKTFQLLIRQGMVTSTQFACISSPQGTVQQHPT
jgi:hypothetical protein